MKDMMRNELSDGAVMYGAGTNGDGGCHGDYGTGSEDDDDGGDGGGDAHGQGC